jgi:hypothetical protein
VVVTVIATETVCPEASVTVAEHVPAFSGATVKIALGPAIAAGPTAATDVGLEHVSLSVNAAV